MARPKKNNVEDAARLADELIAAQAAGKIEHEESAQDENELPPVDDLEVQDDKGVEDLEGYDLSSLDETPPPHVPEDKDLSHKLSVLQGKYNAETERLSSLLSQTMTELQDLKAKFASRSTPTLEIADLSDDDADINALKGQFPTLYKSFMALARTEASKEVGRATRETSEKVNSLAKQSEDERKQTYLSRLGDLIPNWEQINNHPSFWKWLNGPDEFSGTTRKSLLGAAFNRNDHATTAKFFNAFIKEKGIRVRGKITDDSEGLAPDTSGASVNRNVRATPGTITRAQMQQFYQDKAHGRLSGTQAEIDKMEARFFQAVREGKVVS